MATDTTANDGGLTLQRWGAWALRWSLVLIFFWFGMMKFTAYEAKGIAPLVMNSPLLAWAYNLLGERGFATALGVVELTIGVLIALRPFSARWSGIGSVASIITYLVTLTFLLSTPGVWQEGYGFPFLSGPIGQFLIKDFVLLAASIWTAGEAFTAARLGTGRPYAQGVAPVRTPSRT